MLYTERLLMQAANKLLSLPTPPYDPHAIRESANTLKRNWFFLSRKQWLLQHCIKKNKACIHFASAVKGDFQTFWSPFLENKASGHFWIDLHFEYTAFGQNLSLWSQWQNFHCFQVELGFCSVTINRP